MALQSFVGYFLTPLGLLLMGILDSSLVFFLPLGIDVVVMILSGRRPELFWLYALLAATGSVAGAGGTFWLGRKIGKHGLARLIKPARLARVQQRVHASAAGVAALAIIPPPFPFTAFVLTSGALRVDASKFFLTLAVVRLGRFAVEGALAAHYGRGIVASMESRTFSTMVIVVAALAATGTIVSGVSVYRSTRRREPAPESL